VSVTVEPEQLIALLTVGTGLALTVTVVVTVVEQGPLATTYDMVVVPTDTADTTPPALMVATAVFDELQTPDAVVSDNVVVAPAHRVVVPVIAPTTG
jgi:hypothetical protein